MATSGQMELAQDSGGDAAVTFCCIDSGLRWGGPCDRAPHRHGVAYCSLTGTTGVLDHNRADKSATSL